MSADAAAGGAAREPLTALVALLRQDRRGIEAALAERGGDPGAALADWLYANWYLRPDGKVADSAVPPGRHNLVPLLQAALAATGRWTRGWVALGVLPDHACVAGMGPLTRVVMSGSYANASRPGVPVAPGDCLTVLERPQWLDAASGYWAACSPLAEPAAPLCRLYLSLDWQRVAAAMRLLVPALDAAARPWSLKCPCQAGGFARPDTLVVYVGRADWPAFEPVVTAALPRLLPLLRDTVPPLTLPLASGIALADDPAGGLSFGQSRCSALAEGALAVLNDPRAALPQAVAWLEDSLRRHGIDPAQPWRADHGQA